MLTQQIHVRMRKLFKSVDCFNIMCDCSIRAYIIFHTYDGTANIWEVLVQYVKVGWPLVEPVPKTY